MYSVSSAYAAICPQEYGKLSLCASFPQALPKEPLKMRHIEVFALSQMCTTLNLNSKICQYICEENEKKN